MNCQYVQHILQIKMWEWEAVKEKWDMEIQKNGPEEYTVNFHNHAGKMIKEIKQAMAKLNKWEESFSEQLNKT